MQSGCLIYLAQIGSLACGVQNPFSLLALAIRSRFSFLLGHALAALALAILAAACGSGGLAREERNFRALPSPPKSMAYINPPSPSLCSSPPLHTPLPLRYCRRGELRCRRVGCVPRGSSPFSRCGSASRRRGSLCWRAPARRASSFFFFSGEAVFLFVDLASLVLRRPDLLLPPHHLPI